jgi:hypothetical protein
MRYIIIFLFLFLSVSCSEPFHGSHVVANISVGSEVDPNTLVTPSQIRTTTGYDFLAPGDPGYIDHYELYAGINGMGNVRLKNFQIRPVLDIHHPCMQFIPDELDVSDDADALNMCQAPYPALEERTFVIVAPPPTDIGTSNPGYNYLEWAQELRTSGNEVEVPSCTADASGIYPKIQYNPIATEEFCNNLHKDYYLGNPFQITRPISGSIYGFVDGSDPRTGLMLGGMIFSVEYSLEDITSIFLVADPNPERLNEDQYNENLPPSENGEVILLGELDGSFGYIDKEMIEGTWHGLMVHPQGESLRMEFTLYYDMDEDPVLF